VKWNSFTGRNWKERIRRIGNCFQMLDRKIKVWYNSGADNYRE
jgi:predicted O-linked N-acetylglucosamine transferase (SPINDLY family)